MEVGTRVGVIHGRRYQRVRRWRGVNLAAKVGVGGRAGLCVTAILVLQERKRKMARGGRVRLGVARSSRQHGKRAQAALLRRMLRLLLRLLLTLLAI